MWFRKKDKEKTKEEVLADMKAKSEQIEKLKEEINNMGKLIMVNGKLTKQEDKPTNKNEEKVQTVTPQTQEQRIDQATIRQQQEQQQIEEEIRRQMAIRQEQQRQAEHMERLRQQQMYEEQMAREQAIQNDRSRPRPMVPPPLDDFPEEIRQEPTHHTLEPVVFIIEVVTGNRYEIPVVASELEDFIAQLNSAIDNQTSVQVGDIIMNGRNIVLYTTK